MVPDRLFISEAPDASVAFLYAGETLYVAANRRTRELSLARD